MAVVERFKRESMYGLPPKKSGHCREVAVSGGSTVVSFCDCVISTWFRLRANFCT